MEENIKLFGSHQDSTPWQNRNRYHSLELIKSNRVEMENTFLASLWQH